MTQEEERVVTRTDRTDVGVAPPVTLDPTTGYASGRQVSQQTVVRRASGTETIRRVIILVFGLIQLVIGLRIILLLLNAREGNAIVSGIVDLSQVFVAPFSGILGSDALRSGGAVLDIAALVALVGWTILELIVLAIVSTLRREP